MNRNILAAPHLAYNQIRLPTITAIAVEETGKRLDVMQLVD